MVKDLIRNIKQNRLPKESLHLVEILNNKNNHKLFYCDIMIKSKKGKLLFLINDVHKSINPSKCNIFQHLFNTQLIFNSYNPEEIIHIIGEAIKNSDFNQYRIML